MIGGLPVARPSCDNSIVANGKLPSDGIAGNAIPLKLLEAVAAREADEADDKARFAAADSATLAEMGKFMLAIRFIAGIEAEICEATMAARLGEVSRTLSPVWIAEI